MTPQISVVIPCYNGEAYLGEAIRSALHQTLPPCEVLVIDDGSTDRSREVAASCGAAVRVLTQPNQGESVARNRGMQEAVGDWIAFLDADDLWLPRKLEEQARLITPDVVCIHTAIEQIGTRCGVIDRSRVPPATRYSPEWMAPGNGWGPSTLLVRRTVSARFPTWTRYGEDLIFQLDLLQDGEIRMVSEPLTQVRFHETNQSGKDLIELDYFRSIERWMDERTDVLSARTRHRIRQAWERRLVGVALEGRRQGRRDWFEQIRSELNLGTRFRWLCLKLGYRQWCSRLLRSTVRQQGE